MKHIAQKIFAASAIALLAACGGGGDDEPTKDLFSLWTSEQTGAPMDLTGLAFGSENHLNLYTADGTRCICDLAVVGTQASGSIALTGCISIPYNASRQPMCEAINGAGSYTNSNAILSINRNGSVGTFR